MECDAGKGRIAFITMGCAKNEVDTSEMARALQAAGYVCGVAPESADVVIVNTCSFIQAATEESVEAILDACELPHVRRGACAVIVAGCMPARYGTELERELPEVTGFVTCADEADIVKRVDAVLGARRANEHSCGDSETCAFYTPCDSFASESMREKFAYVKISDGCDRFCSFCIIPYIRGRYHSFTLEHITSEIKRATGEGAREIVLIGQDTSRWGSDLEGTPDLAYLLEQVAGAFPELRFRVMYVQPEGVSDELIDTIAAHDNLCNYFDIPFQHVVPSLLTAMNREGSAQDFLALIGRIRTAMPDVALRTTLMVGFPGETEEDFEQLLAFIEEAELDYVGAFAYSQEEPAQAASFEGQLADEVKHERLQELRMVADAISSAVIARRVGSVSDVIVCGQEEDGQWYGRTATQAPEVDGITFISFDEGDKEAQSLLQAGKQLHLHIDDTLFYDMEGHIING